MGLFGKIKVKESDHDYWKTDDSRFRALETNSEVTSVEAQVDFWMLTDEGWEEFTNIFTGAPVIVTETQIDISISELLNSLSEYIATQERLDKVKEGMLRSAAVGYAIGIAQPYLNGIRPQATDMDSQILDKESQILADETAKFMGTNPPSSDVEWFGYTNRSGIWAYQTMLKPLGESSDGVLERAETGLLMLSGRWFIRYGIGLAKTHLKLQSPYEA